MADDRHEQKQVLIRIPEDEKEKWKDAAEESYGSLKHLISESVSKELSNEYVHVKAIENTNASGDEIDMSPIEDRLEGLESSVDTVIERIDEFDAPQRNEVEELSEEELQNLAFKCQDNLPIVDGEDEMRGLEMTGMEDEDIIPKITGRAQDIAKYLGEDVTHVRKALLYLENNVDSRVRSIIDGGNRRWYEERPEGQKGGE